MNATVNNQLVEVELIPSGDALVPQELWALETLDQTLRGNADFTGRYPNAKLVRVDSMRLLLESTPGRYYLRYSSDRGMVEFWGHVSRQARLDLKRGIFSITNVPSTTSSHAASV